MVNVATSKKINYDFDHSLQTSSYTFNWVSVQTMFYQILIDNFAPNNYTKP